MEWQIKAIRDGSEKILISSALAVCFFIVLTIWIFATGKTFWWQSIEVLSPLPPWAKLWSGLTFSTTGFVLFHLGFYRVLYQAIPFYPLYSLVKAIIWLVLTLLTYWFFDALFKVVNSILSFFYNIWQLFLFIFPAIGITLGLTLLASGIFLLYKKRTNVVIKN